MVHRRLNALVGLALAVAAPVEAVTPDEVSAALGPGMRRAVVIGDSISRGGGAPKLNATDTFAFKFFEAGIFTTVIARRAEVAIHLDEYVRAVNHANMFDPWDFTLILLGTNDYTASVPLERIVEVYSQFLRDVQGHAGYRLPNSKYQTLFCVTPLRRAQEWRNHAGYTLPELRRAISNLCGRLDIPVIDGLSLLPEDPTLAKGTESNFFADGVHPNRRGHAMIAERLLRQIVDHFDEQPTWLSRQMGKQAQTAKPATSEPTPPPAPAKVAP